MHAISSTAYSPILKVGLMRLVRRSRSGRGMVVHKRQWLSRGGTGSHSPTIHVARRGELILYVISHTPPGDMNKLSRAGSLGTDLIGLSLMPRQCVSGVSHSGDQVGNTFSRGGHFGCKSVSVLCRSKNIIQPVINLFFLI